MMKSEYTVYIDDSDIGVDFGMKLKSYEVQSYGKRKIIGTDVPGAHGTQLVPSALASGDFFANVICTGATAEDVNNQIREFFAFMYSSMNAHKVVFSDDEGVTRYAVLDAPEKYRVISGVDGAFAELKLTFFMADPFVYGSERTQFSAVAEDGKEVQLWNESFECPAIFKMRNIGSEDITYFTIVVNNELASFLCDVPPDGVVELDTEEYEVRVNGISRLDCWNGAMPLLKNGLNKITVNTKQNYNMELTVSYTKRWT